jgi:hypothetical protein
LGYLLRRSGDVRHVVGHALGWDERFGADGFGRLSGLSGLSGRRRDVRDEVGFGYGDYFDGFSDVAQGCLPAFLVVQLLCRCVSFRFYVGHALGRRVKDVRNGLSGLSGRRRDVRDGYVMALLDEFAGEKSCGCLSIVRCGSHLA